MSVRFDRRKLLAALGVGAGSLLLPPVLSRRGSRALADGPPPRIVFFFTMQGINYDTFHMRPDGLGEDSDWEVRLDGEESPVWSEILEPLEAIRDRVLVLDGLSVPTALAEENAVDPHAIGHVHTMSCRPTIPVGAAGAVSSGPSIDQIIASGIRRPDRVPSLEYAVGPLGVHRAFFSQARSVLPAEQDPLRAWERLFAAEPSGNNSAVEEAQERVLQAVQQQYSALLPQLTGDDRRRLETHRDLVEDLQGRVRWIDATACAPEPPDFDHDVVTNWVPEDYSDVMATFQGIVGGALACDVTRVVTLNAGDLPHHLCDAPPGDIHADYAHQIYDSPEAAQVMTNYARAHCAQFVDLVETLRAIPEGDGSLLDNTLVVWCSEVGDGAHDFERWPVVLAGGSAFDLGRYVRWAPRLPNPNRYPTTRPLVGPGNGSLWVSICQALGLDIDSFGLTSVTTADGVEVDLTGPLDRLLG